MTRRLMHSIKSALYRAFPEQRLFLRSDTTTRFVRLSPVTQIVGFTGSALIVAWAIFATSILLMDSIGAGSIREQAAREQALYEERLNALSTERDIRAAEALQAQDRFNVALDQISAMQSALLASEDRRKELETGIDVIQATLRRTMKERDAAREQASILMAQSEGGVAPGDGGEATADDIDEAFDLVTAALAETAAERDTYAAAADRAMTVVSELELEQQLMEERNARIFTQLEDAVSVSLEPLDKMFEAAGLPADSIIETVRRGYSGQGGPLSPLRISTKGGPPHPDSLRANAILDRLDELNLYRIAVEKTPFALPLNTTYRFTSGFGPRWGRMHEGADFAGAHGSPILATANGTVIHAGPLSGYGKLVKIKHDFGLETRYAHMSKIRVKVGQRVSRGDHIGDMGNTGRSTGTHLHYEVRVGGKAVNPMTYIKAARDVF